MGLIALLVATIIIILLLIFGNSLLSPFASSSSPISPKSIENKAQDAVDSTNENSKVEQNQIKDLDLP